MIVRCAGDHLWMIRQTDHAGLSGTLARHWGNDRFAPPEPFDSVALAATLHDNGWEEWESGPRVNPATRRPYQFTELPVEEHVALYLRGVERVIARDPYAGLLVSMHCEGLYNQRFGIDPSLPRKEYSPAEERTIAPLRERLQAQQRELREVLAAQDALRPWLEEKAIWANYKLLQIFDRLSLALCMQRSGQATLQPAPLDYRGNETALALQFANEQKITVNPYPFLEDPVPLSVEARALPKAQFADDDELRQAYARAEPVVLTMELTASDGPDTVLV